MGVCKCTVPSRHGGILNIRRAASSLGRFGRRGREVEDPDLQVVLPQNWGGTESNHNVMVLKTTVNEFLINLDVEMGKFTHVIVTLKSVVSHHTIKAIRPKNSVKMEMIKFDPHAQKHVLYQEMKKPVNFIP
ncbi:hypothetical protein TNCV_525101 [Trichonephila clavipes]|nr:hypothetical protein TNCV_525101 [Trichonephila clavipes]